MEKFYRNLRLLKPRLGKVTPSDQRLRETPRNTVDVKKNIRRRELVRGIGSQEVEFSLFSIH